MDPGLVWPGVVCPEWELQAETSCEERWEEEEEEGGGVP